MVYMYLAYEVIPGQPEFILASKFRPKPRHTQPRIFITYGLEHVG